MKTLSAHQGLFVVAAVVAAFGQPLNAQAEAASDVVGEVTTIIGVADVKRRSGEGESVRRGSTIRAGDRVETGAGAHVHIRFIDGIDLVVIDASFIGMAKLLPAARAVLRAATPGPAGRLLAMIKPQFEVGPANLRKGVVRDATVRAAAIAAVAEAARGEGFEVHDVKDSVLEGPEGNLEAFLWASRER